MTEIRITSFGYLHGTAPEADIALDLRRHFRDPHVSPELRHMTAEDEEVQTAVKRTPGIGDVVRGVVGMTVGYLGGPAKVDTVTIAVGCAGGRHRAAVVAEEIARRLRYVYSVNGDGVDVVHRDLHRPVVER
jgi:RNase adaptor protein for sRNA GlmZ degradation